LAHDRLLARRVVAKTPHGVPRAALLVLVQPVPGDGAWGENLFGFFHQGGSRDRWRLLRLGAGGWQKGQQEKATFHG
jgi:hypothetical protein